MERTIWRGQSATLTIGTLQPATLANNHISKYVFHSASTGLTGVGELAASSTTVHANTSVNSEKKYTITSYLLYKHNFAGGSTVATSNRVDNTLTVHEPLDAQSLTKIEPITTELIHDWVWSNATSATFGIIPTFSHEPWSTIGKIVSDATTPTAAKGYTNSLDSDDINARNEITWFKTTGNSTDLGKGSENITVYVESTKESAPTPGRITERTATFVVRNAVTALGGLDNKELYAGSAALTETVSITPAIPFSKDLILVDDKGQDVSSKSITSTGGAKVSLSGQTITLDASAVKVGTAKQTIKFKVRSRQSNAAVDTDLITFIVNGVADIFDKVVVEGGTISVEPGIGTIQTARIDSGSNAISISKSGANLSITGLGVDEDTPWSIIVTNADGAHITISGITTHLANVSASINTGDYIIVGKTTLAGIGDSIIEIITKLQANQGKVSLEGGWLKYEASTANGPINPGTYAIKVKGANGATRTVNITVSNITATLS